MKKSIHFLIAALLFAGCNAGSGSEHDVPVAAEIRGVWITNVDSDVLFSKEAIAEAMDYLAERGFNVVFPVVWNKGLTLYPSDVMSEYFGEAFRIDTAFASGRDPLQELIVEARRNGMEVMPWFEFGFSSSYQDSGGYILQRYPEWAALDVNGNLLTKNGFEWMNPLHHEVQDFMLSLIGEVIENYDIDGIQGDDRLPAMPSEGGYSPFTRALYEQETGRPVPDDPREPHFLQWKADKLTDFGGRLYALVNDYDPELMVSLSPSIYPWSLHEYLQDWPEWIRRKQVDLLHPQNYRYEIDRYISTADTMAWYAGRLTDDANNRYIPSNDVIVAPGILIKAGNVYNGPEYVRAAVEHNRNLGLDGEVYFFYEGLDSSNEFLADTLFKYFYSRPADLPYRRSEARVLKAPVAVADPDMLYPPNFWEIVEDSRAFAGKYYRVAGNTDIATGTVTDTTTDTATDIATDTETVTVTARASFKLSIERAGKYELYLHIPYGSGITELPDVTVKYSSGETRYRPDLKQDIFGGWIRIVDLKMIEKSEITVILNGKHNLIADAVMALENHKTAR